MAVLSVGYLVLDVVTTTRIVGRSAGGTAGNVAANLAWLGTRAGVLARIGDDPAGMLLHNDLSVAGVDTRHIHRSSDVETPVLIQQLTESGPRYLFSCPTCRYKFASHRPATPAQAEEAAASGAKILFADRASKASLDLMSKVKAQGGIVMFEPNGPGRPALTAEAIATADILKVSEDRVSALGALLTEAPSNQVQIRTRAAQGLEFRLGEASWHSRRARPALVADSAGAGDWVTAGLLAHLAESPQLTYRNINEGLGLGQALAAMSCAFVGARGMNATITWAEAAPLLRRTADMRHYGQGSPQSHTQICFPDHACPACGSKSRRPTQ